MKSHAERVRQIQNTVRNLEPKGMRAILFRGITDVVFYIHVYTYMHIYIYAARLCRIFIYIDTYIGGWGDEPPNGKSFWFLCARDSEARLFLEKCPPRVRVRVAGVPLSFPAVGLTGSAGPACLSA